MSTQRVERSNQIGALLTLGLRAHGADVQGEAGAFEHVMQVQQHNIPPVQQRARREEEDQEQAPRRREAPITEAARTTSQDERQEMREEAAEAPVMVAPRARTESREAPVPIKGPPPKAESRDATPQTDAAREDDLHAMAQAEQATALIAQLAEQLLPVAQTVTATELAVPTLSPDTADAPTLSPNVPIEGVPTADGPTDAVPTVAVSLIAPAAPVGDSARGAGGDDDAPASSDLVHITFHSNRAVSPKRQDMMDATKGAVVQKAVPSDDRPVPMPLLDPGPLVRSGTRVLLHSTAAQRALGAAAATEATGASGQDLRAAPLQQMAASQALRGAALPQASLRIRSVPVQVGEELQAAIREKRDVVRIQLEPPSFGKIYVRVGMRHNEVHVAFMAEQPFTRDALERGLPHLRNLLQEQGLSLGDVHVGFGDEAAWQESLHGERFFAERPAQTDEQAAEAVERPRFVRPTDPQSVVDVSV